MKIIYRRPSRAMLKERKYLVKHGDCYKGKVLRFVNHTDDGKPCTSMLITYPSKLRGNDVMFETPVIDMPLSYSDGMTCNVYEAPVTKYKRKSIEATKKALSDATNTGYEPVSDDTEIDFAPEDISYIADDVFESKEMQRKRSAVETVKLVAIGLGVLLIWMIINSSRLGLS